MHLNLRTRRPRRSTYAPASGVTLAQGLTIWALLLTACLAAIFASLVIAGRLG